MDQQSQTKFRVVLHCTKSNQSETKDIWFESFPINTLEINERIQKQFSIPVCVQILSFEGCTLKGSNSLSALRARDGDIFRVEYLAKGDCSVLTNIISWLGQLSRAMTSKSSDLNDIIKVGMQQRLLEKLRSCFSPWSDPTSKTYVNKLYFLDSGFEIILKVYEFLLQTQRNHLFRYLETWIIRSLWSFAQTAPLRRLMIRHNVTQMLTQSLLQVRLEEGREIRDPESHGRSFLIDTIKGSIGALFK